MDPDRQRYEPLDIGTEFNRISFEHENEDARSILDSDTAALRRSESRDTTSVHATTAPRSAFKIPSIQLPASLQQRIGSKTWRFGLFVGFLRVLDCSPHQHRLPAIWCAHARRYTQWHRHLNSRRSENRVAHEYSTACVHQHPEHHPPHFEQLRDADIVCTNPGRNRRRTPQRKVAGDRAYKRS